MGVLFGGEVGGGGGELKGVCVCVGGGGVGWREAGRER